LIQKNISLYNWISINRITGPSAIAANELVACSYSTNAGQSISTGSDTIIDFEDLVVDTHSSVTTGASWKFTAPVSGTYSVSKKILTIASANWSAGNNGIARIYKNGIYEKELSRFKMQATLNPCTMILSGDTLLPLVKGDYIDIRVYQDNGSTENLDSNFERNFISINRIGF